jgi:hypothetical protein
LGASINVDYSALPAWTTASGNVLSAFITGSAISTIDLAATDAASYAITTGSLAPGLTMDTTDGDIDGTITGSTYTTYNFTVNAIDAQAQSSPRLFNIITAAPLPSATGGTITTYTGFRVHTFLIGQTGEYFTPDGAMNVDYLVIAGGAAGGNGGGAGGGGAGGFRTGTGLAVTAQAYTITVGAGGALAADNNVGNAGGVSTFSSITSAGGGGGGYGSTSGVAGGSGGGGPGDGGFTPGAGNTPSTSPVQGYAGGSGTVNSHRSAGGGGGAGGLGVNGAVTGSPLVAFPGNGGVGSKVVMGLSAANSTLLLANASVGVVESSDGNARYLAGGGGGGSNSGASYVTQSTGGLGGGGRGVDGDGGGGVTNGTANTGSGGGADVNSTSPNAGAGGSGVVMIRYVA